MQKGEILNLYRKWELAILKREELTRSQKQVGESHRTPGDVPIAESTEVPIG